MNKILFFALFAFLSVFAVSAQQITRFAVIDLPTVYQAFFLDSREVREFEERRAFVQSEIERMNREIMGLRSAGLDAASAGNYAQAQQIQEEARNRTEFLREFIAVRNAELEEQRRGLAQTDSFLERMLNEIRIVAEREGFSMVLNLSDTQGIIWFSPTVDITERVVQSLNIRR